MFRVTYFWSAETVACTSLTVPVVTMLTCGSKIVPPALKNGGADLSDNYTGQTAQARRTSQDDDRVNRACILHDGFTTKL